ncbi:MAG: carotenoid oxygenase family protein, partial [Caulobacterales bacterium]|nr:carotenoid oxygenase family protein [Caulobacterales bacterium]
MITVKDRHEIRIDTDGNPLLEGGYAPIEQEIVADCLAVVGEVPANLSGAYVRNGPNPRFQPRGRYHLFDGDGMLHAARFSGGEVSYRNKWIRTRGFEMEGEAGRSIWPGLMEMPDRDLPIAWGSDHWLKDASNTDVVPFNGRLLTTFYQCGTPYIVDIASLDTVGPMDTEGLKIRQVSAHSRTDLNSGEFMFFDYDTKPPYMTYGVLNRDGSLRHFTDIELPAARLPHDMAITPNYSILMDLSMFWDPALLQRDVHKVTFYPDLPSRFAIVPRYGSNEDVRWFEAEPCYIYHVINAWEEGESLVLDVCRMRTPEPPPERLSRDDKYGSLIAWANLDAQ